MLIIGRSYWVVSIQDVVMAGKEEAVTEAITKLIEETIEKSDEIEGEIAEEVTTGLVETATGAGAAWTKLMRYRCGNSAGTKAGAS